MRGDFNIDLLSDKSFANDLSSTFGFTQQIVRATRITSISATLIDHIYTLGLVGVSSEVTELHIADHCATSCTLKLNSNFSFNAQKHAVRRFCSMKNVNNDVVNADLADVL